MKLPLTLQTDGREVLQDSVWHPGNKYEK